jgi:DNA-directed RNA polymerase specialized sigma24 family protein
VDDAEERPLPGFGGLPWDEVFNVGLVVGGRYARPGGGWDANDVAATLVMQLMFRLEGRPDAYDHVEDPERYIAFAARNVAKDLARGAARRQARELPASSAPGSSAAGNEFGYLDQVAAVDDVEVGVVAAADLANRLSGHLTEQEARVLTLMAEGQTVAEIAAVMAVSHQRVSQLRKSVHLKARRSQDL